MNNFIFVPTDKNYRSKLLYRRMTQAPVLE